MYHRNRVPGSKSPHQISDAVMMTLIMFLTLYRLSWLTTPSQSELCDRDLKIRVFTNQFHVFGEPVAVSPFVDPVAKQIFNFDMICWWIESVKSFCI